MISLIRLFIVKMKASSWKLLDSGVRQAESHMQMDEFLLNDFKKNQDPILHFYEWQQDSATYGYFIKPEKYLDLEKVKERGLNLAKRPTGGGIVFHLTDLAFSVLLPSSHPGFSMNVMNNYAFINDVVKEAVVKFIGKNMSISLLANEQEESVLEASSFCMAKPTKYDLILNGQKLGGAAQRLTKFGLLHQGTISLKLPSDEYLKDVLLSENILTCMKKNSCLLLKENQDEKDFEEAKNKIKQLLIDAFFSR